MVYNLVSAKNVTANALFKHVDYHDAGLLRRLVHGSFMTEVYLTVMTAGNRMVFIEYDAKRAVFLKVGVNDTNLVAYKMPVSVSVDDATVTLEDRKATVKTAEWVLTITSKFKAGIVAAGNTCADGKCFLEVQISPLTDVSKMPVKPHGLIGQTYDGDGVAVMGKMDEYKTRDNVVTTSAMGEGAIEGDASDYEMPSKFATNFKFSRFGLASAKSRDVSKLTGKKAKLAGDAKSAGAAE